jgi:uncharacterized membrane protein
MTVFTSYNQIAGKNLNRLSTLSDGVFAIAMTLLVLDLKVPASELIHSEQEMWRALVTLAPRLLTYLMSFVTLGIFWVGSQTGYSNFSRANRHLTWLSLAFLFGVALMPFSTAVLAEHINLRVALLVYWVNLLYIGIMLFLGWEYAYKTGLMKEEPCDEIYRAVKRRIFIGQGLYALGALLCLINNYWSIGFIVLVQLNFAFAPRLRLLSRI